MDSCDSVGRSKICENVAVCESLTAIFYIVEHLFIHRIRGSLQSQ